MLCECYWVMCCWAMLCVIVDCVWCYWQCVDVVPQTPLVLLPIDDAVRASTPLVRSAVNMYFWFLSMFLFLYNITWAFVCCVLSNSTDFSSSSCVLLLLAWPASCLEHGLWNCRASVHLSVAATAAHLLLWTWRAENIDWLLHGWCLAAAMPQHCAAANVGSATLSADIGSWMQTCKFWSSIYIYTVTCFLLNVQCEGTSWYFVVVLLTHILLSVFQSQWWGAGKSEGLQNEQCLHWHDNWLCSSGCSVSATH